MNKKEWLVNYYKKWKRKEMLKSFELLPKTKPEVPDLPPRIKNRDYYKTENYKR